MDAVELGRQVQRRRKERGLSQEQLASEANVSRNYISIIERGEARNVSMNVINQLALALNTTPVELAGEVENSEILIPPTLRELGIKEGLRFDVIDRLARIPRRGQEPRTVEEWRQLYKAIKRWLDDG